MSIKDVVDDIESGLVDGRYRDEVLDIADGVEEYFDSFEEAASFAEAYDQSYDRRNPCFDPEGYAEQWNEAFDGNMDGIISSLTDED